VQDGKNSNNIGRTRVKKGRKNAMRGAATIPRMSEAKKNEILNHVSKKVSTRPSTLSNLLKGVSYVPNHLPQIRSMVESQPQVSKRQIGKRTYYFKSSEKRSAKQPARVAIA
jgi:hypothetical protein